MSSEWGPGVGPIYGQSVECGQRFPSNKSCCVVCRYHSACAHPINQTSRHPTPPTSLSCLCRLQNFKGSEDVLADYPLPFDAIEQPEAPAAGGRKDAVAKTPARGRRAAAADDSSEEEDEGPQMPQSSDDEEDGEVGGRCSDGHGQGAACSVVLLVCNVLERIGSFLCWCTCTAISDRAHPLLLCHPQERTPARVPPTASRRLPDRAARSARKPLVEAATSSSDDEEEEDSEEEGEDALSPLAENLSPAVRRPSKARRQSSDSVSALRQALQENRIS